VNLRKDCIWEESSPAKDSALDKLNCVQSQGVDEDGSTCKGCSFNKKKELKEEED
jgi:hypothetical protein